MLEYGTSWCSTTNNNIFPSKVDFMRWRDESTTTKAYGFRITYMQHPTRSNDEKKGHYMYDPVEIQQSGAYFSCVSTIIFASWLCHFSRKRYSAPIIEAIRNSENVLENSALFFSSQCDRVFIAYRLRLLCQKKLFVKWIDFSHAKKLVGTDTKDDGVLIGLVSFIKFLRQL